MAEKILKGINFPGLEGTYIVPQGDWNENDETKGSYIKNRTHWMEASLGTPLIENITVSNSFFIPFTQYDENTIQENKNYIFEINGVQYPATYVYDDDRPSKSIIANEFEFIYEYSSSEYGCTLSYKGENPIEEPYNVSIYEAQIVYHKIDKNFLPEGTGGYTPVRGIDYWTDADKAEIKSYVDEAILGGAW